MQYERDSYIVEVLSALSRLLNALVPGIPPRSDGAVTFSAATYSMMLQGSTISFYLVKFIDFINFEKDHCKISYTWHKERGLVP